MTDERPPPHAALSLSETPRGSVFARAGLAMYTFLILYASLYPFSNWQSIGVSPFSFLLAPMPRYWTGFDVIANAVGYVPFGALVVFALYPRIRGPWATIMSLVAGTLLSGFLESIQTFLPNRVSSNLDLVINMGGTLLGAVAGQFLARPLLDGSRLLQLRKEWFVQEASRGLVIVGLWPLAQIYPQGYLFGHGQFMPILSSWISAWVETPVDLVAEWTDHIELTVQEYWLAETIITACGLCGAILTTSCMLRRQAPRRSLLVLLVTAAIAVKLAAGMLLFSQQEALAWLTPGAKGGLLLGTMMSIGLSYAPSHAQRRVAAASLVVSMLVVNLVPANQYFLVTLQAWTQGRFLNFNGAAQFLSLVWPAFALWFLLHPLHRVRRR